MTELISLLTKLIVEFSGKSPVPSFSVDVALAITAAVVRKLLLSWRDGIKCGSLPEVALEIEGLGLFNSL